MSKPDGYIDRFGVHYPAEAPGLLLKPFWYKPIITYAISGFYEDEVPQFHDGEPTHELESFVTAAEVTRYVNKIKELLTRVKELETEAELMRTII